MVKTSRKFYPNLVFLKAFFVWEENSKLSFISLACLTKKFAYGFDRMLLEMALCQVSKKMMIQSGRKMQL